MNDIQSSNLYRRTHATRSREELAKAGQENALSLMQFKSESYEQRAAFYFYKDGNWADLTYRELSSRVRKLSDYLVESALEPGDRIAILSESRPEWGVAFFAAIRSGAIVVPLDVKLTVAELVSILSDARPRLLFVSSELADAARALEERLPFLESVILIDDENQAIGYPSINHIQASKTSEGRERAIDETALIVYTSGTTGTPKGVEISFRNLGFQIMSFEQVLELTAKDTLLSILPLNHLLELTCGLLGALYAGGGICYCHSLFPHEIAQIMREKRVTCMIAVPLFLKMLKGSIEREVNRSSPSSQRLFHLALKAAGWIPIRTLRRLLFYKVHRQLGGRLRAFISGGAPLDEQVAVFFDRLGVPIYQGYGLTETSPVICVNTPKHNRLNSVGRPLSGARVRILENGTKEGEGEILTAGPHVMKGYYKRGDLTKEVIDEGGWLHTGDLGRIDEDGFVYVTGRIKNLIVLASGKKVNPEEVEAAIASSPLIQEVCVVGLLSQNGMMEGSEEVCAVVVPAKPLLDRCGTTTELQREIEKEVEQRTSSLAPFKRPSKIFLQHEDLPKTTTRKIKRAAVLELLGLRQQTAAKNY